MKKALTGMAFAASCAAGLAAAMYGITVAYFMGSRAQADLDQCTPADPRLLVRSSFQEIMRMAPAAHPSTIAVEDDAIEVNSLN